MKTDSSALSSVAVVADLDSRPLGATIGRQQVFPAKNDPSTNAVAHGVSARCVLVGEESLAEHQENLDLWIRTLSPKTPGEAQLAAKIADCMLRFNRLDQQVARTVASGVERALVETGVHQQHENLKDAAQALRGMCDALSGQPTGVTFETVQQLTPALRRVLALVESAEVPMKLLLPLQEGLNDLGLIRFIEPGPNIFDEVIAAADEIEKYLAVSAAVARDELDVERERLAEDPTLGDPDQVRLLDRYRRRLEREMAGYMKMLKAVRELTSGPQEPQKAFVHVELRVVDRPILARREG